MAQFLGFVVVGVDGTTLHAEGVSSVEHLDVGLYHITFASSVYNACEIASLGHFRMPGCITAYGVPPYGPDVVEVMTFAANGTPQDLTFQLLVVVPDNNPTTGTIPDVRNETPAFAKSRIENAGFVWSSINDSIPNVTSPYVESTDPSGNTVASLGITVTATIAVPHKGPLP